MPLSTPMSRAVKVNNFSKNLNVLMDERSEAAWPPPFFDEQIIIQHMISHEAHFDSIKPFSS